MRYILYNYALMIKCVRAFKIHFCISFLPTCSSYYKPPGGLIPPVRPRKQLLTISSIQYIILNLFKDYFRTISEEFVSAYGFSIKSMIVALLPRKAGNNLNGLLNCKSGSLDPRYMVIKKRIFRKITRQ